MKKTLALLTLGFAGMVTLASCGSKTASLPKEKDITTMDDSWEKVEDGSSVLSSLNQLYLGSSFEKYFEGKNIVFEENIYPLTAAENQAYTARKVINYDTKSFYYEGHLQDGSVNDSFHLTGIAHEEEKDGIVKFTYDYYLTYSVMDYEIECGLTQNYDSFWDEYIWVYGTTQVSKSGNLYEEGIEVDSAIVNDFNYIFKFMNLPLSQYYVHGDNEFEIVSIYETEKYYQYGTKDGILSQVYFEDSSTELKGTYFMYVTDKEEIKEPDKSGYVKTSGIDFSNITEYYDSTMDFQPLMDEILTMEE